MAKTKTRRNYSKLVFKYLLIFVIGYCAFTFYDQHREMQSLALMEQNLSSELETLQKQVDSMKAQIENSSSDEHIEKIAREQLKMVKKGEMIFIDLGNSHK